MAVISEKHVRAAVDALDENDAGLGIDRQSSLLLRIGKISEELGEVWRAYIGAVGQNPRKGYYADFWNVAEELADVALTAIVAMASVDPAGWERILQDTVTTKTTRLLAE